MSLSIYTHKHVCSTARFCWTCNRTDWNQTTFKDEFRIDLNLNDQLRCIWRRPATGLKDMMIDYGITLNDYVDFVLLKAQTLKATSNVNLLQVSTGRYDVWYKRDCTTLEVAKDRVEASRGCSPIIQSLLAHERHRWVLYKNNCCQYICTAVFLRCRWKCIAHISRYGKTTFEVAQ